MTTLLSPAPDTKSHTVNIDNIHPDIQTTSHTQTTITTPDSQLQSHTGVQLHIFQSRQLGMPH